MQDDEGEGWRMMVAIASQMARRIKMSVAPVLALFRKEMKS